MNKLSQSLLIGFLSAQLVCTGCTHTATIKQPKYQPFIADLPISAEDLQDLHQSSPKDRVFADLLQAFALMRSAPIEKEATRKEITSLLMTSVSSFEDMTDPVNFSKAFSADEDKAFRGRPHERMFASAMTGVFLMADNKCSMALPYLRNAEFLDARFQKMPFGTDAPFVYALMYRCLSHHQGDASELKRAADGVARSIRFLTWQEPMIKALVELAKTDLRPMAISNRLAYMIFEISIYHSLISSPQHSLDELIDDASRNAAIFVSSLDSHFEDEYKSFMKPAVSELAAVYGLDKKEGMAYLEDLAFQRVALDVKSIGDHLKKVFRDVSNFKADIKAAVSNSERLTEQILHAARSDKLVLNFSGRGPSIEREGSYDEISVVKPSPDSSVKPGVRERTIKSRTDCGFHRTAQGGFSVVLCQNTDQPSVAQTAQSLPSLEILSLSYKAKNIAGRQFDKVLKGRAQFRAATENIAAVSAWSAFFLFYMGTSILSDCQRRGQGEACYAAAYALWAIAGITVIFSGSVWLIGRSSNPAADSRYIHLMYESAWLAI